MVRYRCVNVRLVLPEPCVGFSRRENLIALPRIVLSWIVLSWIARSWIARLLAFTITRVRIHSLLFSYSRPVLLFLAPLCPPPFVFLALRALREPYSQSVGTEQPSSTPSRPSLSPLGSLSLVPRSRSVCTWTTRRFSIATISVLLCGSAIVRVKLH